MFSDQELERLLPLFRHEHEGGQCHMEIELTCERFKALLQRLEAAEKVLNVLEKCEDLRNFEWFHHASDCFKAWRTSAGK